MVRIYNFRQTLQNSAFQMIFREMCKKYYKMHYKYFSIFFFFLLS